MCLRCDGYSEKQIQQMTEMQIAVHGWGVVAVDDHPPVAYSIGVLENYGHPELVVMDIETLAAQQLINHVGALIRDGGGALDRDVLSGQGIQIVEVHPTHLRSGLVGGWARYYGERPRAGDFVQILPPPQLLCACHRDMIHRLDLAA